MDSESMRGRREASKIVFYALVCLGVAAASFGAGIKAGEEHNAAFRLTESLKSTVENAVTVTAGELVSTLRKRPDHFLQRSRYPGQGVTYNDTTAGRKDDLVLIAGFFDDTNELRLIRRSGEIVARWPVRFYDLFPHPDYFPAGWEPATNWNIDIHGALALPDGSVVFNFEWGGLAKLDRCGNIVWTVRRQTHHAIERAEGGGFWVLSRRLVEDWSPYPPFETPFQEDTILKISDAGQILAELFPVRAFYNSNLSALLTATGYSFESRMEWDHELVHMNKVGELTSDVARDFPMFERGDLIVSLRDHNLIAVVDKGVTRVKWWQIGPWLRQHDPEFRRGGTIAIFNNNVHQTAFGGSNDFKIVPNLPAVSNIMEVDPATHAARVIYGGQPGQELLSVIKGKIDLTARGDLLITEAQGGRVREIDANGRLVWEYVNRYDEADIAEIGEARLYSPDYFTVKDWTCP
jgi:hypothetical protein